MKFYPKLVKHSSEITLNQADKFILAIVLVDGVNHQGPYYLKNPFNQEPDFGVASINYDLKELLSKVECL